MSEVATQAQFSPSTTHLINAVKNNQHLAAKTAIKQGANVNVMLPSGNRLLHICLDEAMGTILINHGANVNATNAFQQTPLHTSMMRDIIPLTLLLINSGSDVNAQDLTGYTPLDLAEANVVNDALLSKQANPNIQDNAGDTSLHLAIRIKGSPIVTALINAGADKTIKNLAGNDAYDELNLLIQRRNSELAKVRDAIYNQPTKSAALESTLGAPPITPAFNLSQKFVATNLENSKIYNAKKFRP